MSKMMFPKQSRSSKNMNDFVSLQTLCCCFFPGDNLVSLHARENTRTRQRNTWCSGLEKVTTKDTLSLCKYSSMKQLIHLYKKYP